MWMKRQVILFGVVGLLGLLHSQLASAQRHRQQQQQQQKQQTTFGSCSLSMSEAGECAAAYHTNVGSNESSSNTNNNATILRGGVKKKTNETNNTNTAYIPFSIGVSIPSHPAPTTVTTTRKTSSGSVRATNSTTTTTAKPSIGSIRRSAASIDNDNNNKIIESHWGEDQTVGDGVTSTQIREVVGHTDYYMRHTVYKQKEFRKVRKHCINQHPECSQWAIQGECQSNKMFMQIHCAPACLSCEMLDIQKRCPIDPSLTPNVWGPGDLNRFFERITTDPFYEEQYGPVRVLSRPHLSRKERTRRVGHNNKVKEDGPWLVGLDNFLSSEECEKLIEIGNKEGYEPSFEVGKARVDGTRERIRSTGRTSYNAWCWDECEQDATIQKVLEKLHNLTSIPKENVEHLQLLRYEKGQQYANHYDFSHYESERPQGVRLLTVFLYLNDVEEGGETEFTGLKRQLTITPKLGRALIWPNVLDHDPESMERRTKHRALPMGPEGVKYGVNAWFHQRDFRTPHSLGCTV